MPVRRIAFGPGGNLLALDSRQGAIHLLDTASGQELGRLVEGNGPTVSTAISPDGKLLVSTDGKSVVVWDIATQGFATAPGGSRRHQICPIRARRQATPRGKPE